MPDFLFSEIPQQNLRSGTDIVQTSGRSVLGVAPWRYVSDALATAALMAAHPRFVAQSSNNRYWRALPENGRIPVEVGGAKGDGITDDGPAIRATHAYVAAIAAKGASFLSARYRCEYIPPSEAPTWGSPPIQILTPNAASQDHDGATFVRQAAGRGIFYHPQNQGAVVDLPLGSDVVAGSRDVTLASGGGAQLAAGDTVLWQLGELPYDTPETLNWSFATVLAVNGDVVTLDKPIPESLVLASVTGPCKRLRKLNVLRDWRLSNLTLNGPSEEGVALYAAERVRISNVGGRNMGVGTVTANFCDGLTIEDCWQDGCYLTQASFGAAFGFAETRNTLVLRPRARGTLSLIRAEAGAHVTVIGGLFENTIVNAQGQSLGNQVVVVNALGRASLTLHDLTITGFGGYRLMEVSNGVAGYDGLGQFSGTLRLRHPTSPYSIPLKAITGLLDMTIGGVHEVYNFERLRHWRKRFMLRDGEYRVVFGPAGLLARARAYASPGVTLGAGGQLPNFYLGRLGNNGNNLAAAGPFNLQAGNDVNIPTFAGDVAGAQWTLRNQPLQILCATASNAGLNTANEFVEFEAWFAEQNDLNITLSEDSVRSAGVEADPLEAIFPAYDLPAIAAGASTSIVLPIPDMVPSDFIDSVRFVGGFAGLELRGAEPQAGSVKLLIANPTAVAIDRAPTELGISFHHEVLGR
jgi:hypothetical protein